MDNIWLASFALWPLALIAAALLNMLITWTFSWSELVLDYVAGVVIGVLFSLGLAADAGAVSQIGLTMSHGVFGLLAVAGVDALARPATLFFVSAGAMIGATVITALLDRLSAAADWQNDVVGIGLGLPSFLLKLPFTLVTSGVGALFVVVGAIRAAASPNGSIGFRGGVVYVEWNTANLSTSATTIGCTVQVWGGRMERVFAHELYHSRQYVYLHDWLIPTWLVGGLWGWISSAAAGNFAVGAFQAARHDREVGNPIERAAYRISGHSGY